MAGIAAGQTIGDQPGTDGNRYESMTHTGRRRLRLRLSARGREITFSEGAGYGCKARRAYPFDEDRALEADSGVQTPTLGVRKHRGRVQDGRVDRPSDSDRSRRRGEAPANSQVPALGECRDRFVRVEDDDKLGKVGSDLEAEADAAGCDARGGGPGPVGEAGDDDARAGFAGPYETGLQDGEDGEAVVGRRRMSAQFVRGRKSVVWPPETQALPRRSVYDAGQ